MRTATVIPISIQRMVCTGCGAEANASCNCGVAYQPKSVRAREAVEANPEKSNRAIAEETGLSEATVRRARASSDAPESVTGKDGKSYPAKRRGNDVDVEASTGERKAEYAAAEAALEEKIFTGAQITEIDIREWRKRERERLKEPLSDGEDDGRFTLGDYFEAEKRARKLKDRVNELTEALNVKEAAAGRNWPADMTPKQLKRRNACLKNIAAWQRELEQLHGEVTGQPSWRVEVTTKDGKRLGTGARFGTRGEAEFYNTHFATSQLEGDYATGDVIPCKEKANVLIEGDTIRFAHGDCVLLNWRPIAETAE